MLDPLQFYCRVLCNGMKTRFRMVMIAHPGPGIGFHKRFMWRIIIPPTVWSDASVSTVIRRSGAQWQSTGAVENAFFKVQNMVISLWPKFQGVAFLHKFISGRVICE